jgi:hypothetical protein
MNYKVKIAATLERTIKVGAADKEEALEKAKHFFESNIIEICDNGLYYPWNCKKCEASGREWHSVTFAEHYEVTDAEGTEFFDKDEK